MADQLVFVPVSREGARSLWQGTPMTGPVVAHTTTPELLEALEYTPEMSEDAEYAALVLASVAGLSRHGERVVLVAEVPASSVSDGQDPTNGEVLLEGLDRGSVQAFFTDEPGVPVKAAAQVAQGLSIDEAWEHEEVQALLVSGDLLWHDVSELDHVDEA